MARQQLSTKLDRVKVKRKGIHSKTKTSSSKSSVLYKKKNKGQGK